MNRVSLGPMARRTSPPATVRAATLPTARAFELISKCVQAASELGADIDQASLDVWDQTTRAVIVQSFGEPSDNLERFERASPDYPYRVAADERFAANYRRDTLFAKIATLKSCLEQLSMGLGTAAPERASLSGVAELAATLAFVADQDLTEALRRDLRELEAAAGNGLWKCSLLLCGSIVEAALIDVLDRRRDLATPYLKKGRKFPEDASLHDLIAMAGDDELIGGGNRLLSDTAVGFAKTITEHRDLIHPHAEVSGHIRVDKETAESMLHLLKLVVRDLADANDRGIITLYENK